jgi:cytochrome o ubiquinol oxidase subunit 1
MPLYAVGMLGMTRRMQHYDVPEWQPWLIVAAFGAVLILAGIVCQILQLVVSIRHREQLRDRTGDPWNGRSLEWATASPPPVFNFAIMPDVRSEDAYWTMKLQAQKQDVGKSEPAYQDIEMPRNSPTGFVCAFFATITGFALIWHIWWMVAAGLIGAFATFVVFAWRDHDEYVIPAAEVARIDRANLAERRALLATAGSG